MPSKLQSTLHSHMQIRLVSSVIVHRICMHLFCVQYLIFPLHLIADRSVVSKENQYPLPVSNPNWVIPSYGGRCSAEDITFHRNRCTEKKLFRKKSTSRLCRRRRRCLLPWRCCMHRINIPDGTTIEGSGQMQRKRGMGETEKNRAMLQFLNFHPLVVVVTHSHCRDWLCVCAHFMLHALHWWRRDTYRARNNTNTHRFDTEGKIRVWIIHLMCHRRFISDCWVVELSISAYLTNLNHLN